MRSSPRRWSVFAVAGAAVLSLAQPAALSAAHAASPAPGPADSAPTTPQNVPPGAHTVTLITGDVVTTRHAGSKAGGTVDVRSATGAPVDAHVMESNGDLYVIPMAAMRYVAQGTLDRQLFNVSKLVADGYDDAHRAQLPLIVSYTSAAAGLRARPALPGAAKVRDLGSIQGAALAEDRGHSADFWRAITKAPANGLKAAAKSDEPALGAGIAHVWLDGVVKATLADTTAQIGAPTAWEKGDTGQGVKVAVLDTGIDAAHPDFAGRIATTRSFVPDEDVSDHFGHGTHVASIIAGTGAASGGVERGVAPGAELHIGKVLSNQGQGQDSWVLAGMEWAAVDEHAAVINMSLGAAPTDGKDPLSEAVNRLSAQTGALFVIAAGNYGLDGLNTVTAPGAADAALTVGAVDADDFQADFSSWGPRNGDGGLKPEISAPGVNVLAARSQYAPDGEGSYQTLSGTSMATPHAAGAAALLAAAHPGLTGAQLKDLLVSSSKRLGNTNVFQVGSGRVDVPAALSATVYATSTAFAGGPTDGSGSAVQRPVTYTNTGDASVTLALTVEAPAPTGMFRISDPQVVVPAHGTASATLTIDETKAAGRPAGEAPWSGQIVATDTAGNEVTHTAVLLAEPTHKVTVRIKDSKGNPTRGTVYFYKSGDNAANPYYVDDTGVAEVFVPAGVYSVESFLEVPGLHGPNSLGMALLGDPEVVVDHDQEVTLDATKIRRVDVTAPQRTEATFQSIEYYRSMGGGRWRDFVLTQTGYDSLWAQPTTHDVTNGDFYFSARWRKEQPALTIATKTHTYSDALRQGRVTPLPDGHYRLPLVAVGNGTSADYAGLDVRGKAVVVRRTGDPSGDTAQASEAIKAGAKLLLVVNDRPGRRLWDYSEDIESPAPIDVALLSPDEGEKLYGEASAGGAVLSVDAQFASPYVYDLRWSWHNQIPDSNMIVQGGPKNLAKVNVTFDSPDPTLTGGEFRYDHPDFNPDYAIGLPFGSEPVNSQRVDWVSTQPTYSWGQEAYANHLVYEIEPRTTYQAGSTQTQEWFKPIERPYLNDNYKAPTRVGSLLDFDVPAWGSSDHVGMSQSPHMQNSLTLYQGDTQLAQNPDVSKVQARAPGFGKLPYRLVSDGSRDNSVTPYSSTTHTEWDFTSETPSLGEKAVLPLLQIKYGVDTDEAGKTAKKASLTASATQLPGAVGAGTPSAVTLEVSYDDGHTWQKITSGEDGRFALSAPKKAQFVSLRAHAHDSAGNAVAQTVIRAFGLR
ncbi:S8 family serine peptidase [Streptomyces sp. NPDC056653]|uniref:S8 family peptidase n=1 Tax=Streptomyces sp. NPDC056653 TaxID=3345894 RepID=UPI0036A1AE2B